MQVDRACSSKTAVYASNSTSSKLGTRLKVKMSNEFFQKSFRFAIDRGGTFTDVYAECPYGKVRILKLLSEDPAYEDAPREGIRRILQEV